MVIILIFKFFTVFKIQEGMKKNPDFFIANAVGYALHQCYGSGFDYCLFDTGTENGGQMVNPNRKT